MAALFLSPAAADLCMRLGWALFMVRVHVRVEVQKKERRNTLAL